MAGVGGFIPGIICVLDYTSVYISRTKCTPFLFRIHGSIQGVVLLSLSKQLGWRPLAPTLEIGFAGNVNYYRPGLLSYRTDFGNIICDRLFKVVRKL